MKPNADFNSILAKSKNKRIKVTDINSGFLIQLKILDNINKPRAEYEYKRGISETTFILSKESATALVDILGILLTHSETKP